MFSYKKLFVLGLCLSMHLFVVAQKNTAKALANENELMRSEGKIYVVMAVVIIILTGFIMYLLRLDRKLTKLEKGEPL